MFDSGSGGGSPTAREGEDGCLESVRCLLGDKVDAMGCSVMFGGCDGEHRWETVVPGCEGIFMYCAVLRCDAGMMLGWWLNQRSMLLEDVLISSWEAAKGLERNQARHCNQWMDRLNSAVHSTMTQRLHA